MSSSSKANKLAQEKIRNESRQEKDKALAQQAEKDKEFEESWEILARYDSDVRAQVDRLEQYGSKAIDELKRVFKFTQDKSKLGEAADRILADIESGKLVLEPENPGQE
ncbi:MAG: hypothetical protein RQ741_07010 [Wenzhouxiangellaceae bacterium]|nr:hypothetical protein [Wenzhouxiangellaceae bacterium]